MATPGSWIGKAPQSLSSKQETESTPKPQSEPDLSLDEQIESLERILTKKFIAPSSGTKQTGRNSSGTSGNTRRSAPKKTRSSSRSNASSSKAPATERAVTAPKHAIHQNIATGIFWCDCEQFRSHIEQDATYHMEQHAPKKKPFVRKPHLTDRPLAGNEALQALRDSLPEAEKFNPGKKPRNKENN